MNLSARSVSDSTKASITPIKVPTAATAAAIQPIIGIALIAKLAALEPATIALEAQVANAGIVCKTPPRIINVLAIVLTPSAALVLPAFSNPSATACAAAPTPKRIVPKAA